ncbi:MAG: glycosyltransferase family 2 protein [Muribaculaceae bacterium]|nr:glycosyltransferase family 2 protein [Muribaculaceae bacterium]
MKISVIVLTCNQRELTMQCLRSLAKFFAEDDNELILVDNGSSDGTADKVRKTFPEVRIIELAENRGVAAGRNIGLAAAKGEYLMILDNDTIASPKAVKALATYLEKNPEVGIVAPRLVSPEGKVQRSYKGFPGIGVKLSNVLARGKNSIATKPPIKITEPFYVIGAAQMFTRLVYELAGPLDEKIFFGPEDADFCMAVRGIWKKVVYLPHITIIHHWQRSTHKRLLSKGSARHAGALLYFYIKHHRFF